MKDDKKKKLIKWSIIIGLALLIIFVIVTSIVLHFKRQDLKDLNDKLENLTQEEGLEMDTQNQNYEKSSIKLKFLFELLKYFIKITSVKEK